MAKERNRPALLLGLIAAMAMSLLALRSGGLDSPAPAGLSETPCPEAPASIFPLIFAAISGSTERRMLGDWGNLCYYRQDDAAVIARGPVRHVLIGDSITARWRSAEPDLFTPTTINRGIDGQTSPQILVRFYSDAVALRPKVIHLMIGLNDIAGVQGATTTEAIRNNFRAMADIAAANHIALVIGSITPVGPNEDIPAENVARHIAEFNRWLKQFAAERKLVFADYHAVLGEPDGRLKKALTYDGVHLNKAGYAAMQAVLEQALRQAEAAPREQET